MGTARPEMVAARARHGRRLEKPRSGACDRPGSSSERAHSAASRRLHSATCSQANRSKRRLRLVRGGAPVRAPSTLSAGTSTIAQVMKPFATLPDGLSPEGEARRAGGGLRRLAFETTMRVGDREVLHASSDVFVLGRDVLELAGRKPGMAELKPAATGTELRQEGSAASVMHRRRRIRTARGARRGAKHLLDILGGPNPTWSERDTAFRFAHRSALDGSPAVFRLRSQELRPGEAASVSSSRCTAAASTRSRR